MQGIRKVLYYRLAEILFNGHTKNIFNVISSIRVNEQKIDEDSIAICLGYLGLFMSLVATICGARMWISFTFRGAKSTIKTNDGSTIILHPRDNRIDEGLKLLNEQLFQLMNDTMQLKIENPHNFYKLCEELSKEILTIKWLMLYQLLKDIQIPLSRLIKSLPEEMSLNNKFYRNHLFAQNKYHLNPPKILNAWKRETRCFFLLFQSYFSFDMLWSGR